MISIITTVYKNDKFILEAINSFVKSCNDYEYEILIGIDNCELSLNHLISIISKLNSNIKIFFFTKKVGTYIIRNTLSNIAKYDDIIFFDSDDVMRENTVKNTIHSLKNNDLFRFGYIPFSGNLQYPTNGHINLKFQHHYGAFGIKKKVFLENNGFEPWICAADGEFIWRITSNKYKIELSKDINILYRRHNNNLTGSISTGMNSPLRKKYHGIKEKKIKLNLKNPLSQLSIGNFIEINDDIINNEIELKNILSKTYRKQMLSIIIPTYNNVEYLEDCLNSILKSVKDLNCEILVGIDDCKKTLDFVLTKIFDDRIRFFYFNENLGPYVIKNTLSEISSSNVLLFFDSDDIMKENTITTLLELHNGKNTVKPMYLDFHNNQNPDILKINRTNTYGEGVFLIKKETFLSMNGFEGWRCAADSDFMMRLYKSHSPVKISNEVTFYRRLHSTNLSTSKEFGLSSNKRREFISTTKNRKGLNPSNLVTSNNFYEVSIGNLNNNSVYNIFNILIKKEKNEVILHNLLNKENNNINPTQIFNNLKNETKPVNTQIINTPKDRKSLMDLKKNKPQDIRKQNKKGGPYYL